MLRTLFLLGGRARKAPAFRVRGTESVMKRAATVAAASQKKNEIAAERQFLKMISAARIRHHRQLRNAIKMALAARSSEAVATKRDERYSKNRDRAVAELAKVELEKARGALNARKEAEKTEATQKAMASTSARGAKRKIEREARAARVKASEEAATERFFKHLQKLQEKRDARVQAVVEKSSKASLSTPVEVAEEKTTEKEPEEATSTADTAPVTVAAPKPKSERTKPSRPPAQEKKKAAAVKEAAPVKEAAAVKREAPAPEERASAAPPPPTSEIQKTAEEPEAPPAPVATPQPAPQPAAAAPRRPRRPAAPQTAAPSAPPAATEENVAEAHGEFSAQLEKAKDRATAAPPPTRATSPSPAPAAPGKSWTMPDNSTGLFRL